MIQSPVTATISLERAAATVWDVVVAGAGPAGSFAARQLARRGARTLLVDRKRFPRAKVCGACLNEHALSMLDSAGLGDLIPRLGAPPLRQFRVHCGSRSAGLPLPGGAAVSRDRLDAALAREAIAAGADFLPGVSARLLPLPSSDRRWRDLGLTPVGGAERPCTIGGRIVLLATGLGRSGAPPGDEFRTRTSRSARVGVSGVCSEADEYAPCTISMALGREGYAGLVRIEDGRLNVAAALDRAFVRMCDGPANAVARLLEAAGLPPIDSLASAAWMGTPPLTHRTRPLAGDRVFLIGDAAGYVEPFTGEGIGWALGAADAVVPLVLEGLADWDFRIVKQWAAVYGRLIGRRQRLCRWIAAGLRRPRLAMGVLRVLSCSPWLVNPLMRRISGGPERLEASCP